jgi:hypothetical protein
LAPIAASRSTPAKDRTGKLYSGLIRAGDDAALPDLAIKPDDAHLALSGR